MKLQYLSIRLCESYEDHAGKYEAKIQYRGEKGNIEMILDPDVSNALLACVGEVVDEFGKRAAANLSKCISDSVAEAKALPAISVP